jgi:hypothetical protein
MSGLALVDDVADGFRAVREALDGKASITGVEQVVEDYLVANPPLSGATTSDLAEGSNLYYTNARADARISAAIGASVQAVDADLTAIAALTGTGYARRTGADTWILDTPSGGGSGTVTSVGGTGTVSGLTLTGTVTTSGNLTLGGTLSINGGNWSGTDLAVVDGGTGASTAADARTNLGLVIGTNVQAYDAELAAIAGLTSAADALPYFTGSGTASTTTLTTFGRSLIDDANAAAAQTTLGLVIGTNVQAYDAELAAIAGLTSVADRLPYFTGSGTAALATFTTGGRALVNSAGTADTFPYFSASNVVTLGSVTAYGRSLIDDADAATARSTLGLVIGTNVQAYDADLAAIAGLTSAADALPYFTGVGTASTTTLTTFGRSLIDDANASTARTTLGLVIGTDVLAPFTSQTANTFFAAPNGSSGTPTFRTFAVADLPALEGLARAQFTGSGSPAQSGSGVEILGGASGIVQAGTRTAGVLSYNSLVLDGVTVALRPSGTANLTASAGVLAVTAAAVNEAVETDVASATTTNLASAVSNSVRITGTTTITGLGTTTSGVIRRVRFAGILTLTHNGTSLILPTAANITTAAGDTAEFMSLGSGNWVCTRYDRASGSALSSSGGGSPIVVNTYTASDTWNKPAGSPQRVEVHVFGAGGGGGGGGKAASGTAVSGGGGGGGGSHNFVVFNASDLSSSEAVTIGAAGTGGAGSTVNNTAASNGTAGGTSDFGTKVYAFGGGRGGGGDDVQDGAGGGGANLMAVGGNASGSSAGSNPTGSGGINGSSNSNGNNATTYGGGGGGSISTGAAGGNGSYAGMFGGGGGAAGGGVSTTPTHFAGGTGRPGPGTGGNGNSVSATAGTAGGGAGSAWSSATTITTRAGGGGSGGGSNTAGNGGAGGAGQTPCGGGGGGGASISANGGAGAAGGGGMVVVITYF